jgi:hypothetical protein
MRQRAKEWLGRFWLAIVLAATAAALIWVCSAYGCGPIHVHLGEQHYHKARTDTLLETSNEMVDGQENDNRERGDGGNHHRVILESPG